MVCHLLPFVKVGQICYVGVAIKQNSPIPIFFSTVLTPPDGALDLALDLAVPGLLAGLAFSAALGASLGGAAFASALGSLVFFLPPWTSSTFSLYSLICR